MRNTLDFLHAPRLLEIQSNDKVVLGTFSKLTFIVEDSIQQEVIRSIAKHLGKDVETIVVHGSPNVKGLYSSYKAQGILANGYFLIDGDNAERSPFPGEPHFIQLDKYCMENYLLDPEICASMIGKHTDDISAIILDVVRGFLIRKDNSFAVLASKLTIQDVTESSLQHFDASQIFSKFVSRLGLKQEDFVKKYVSQCYALSKADTVLPSQLVKAILNAS